MSSEITGLSILIRGIVQGVGFRPFVYSLAIRYQLTGWVINSSRGVEIVVNGPTDLITGFVKDLRDQIPPLARIDSFESHSIQPDSFSQFEIRESQPQPGEFIPVSPDVATCPDCQRELFDPSDRRFRYPFINCTNCGPRFTIVQDLPYDRPNTTMAGFPLCPDCRHEYENPLDRRFHAQPVACPKCGPQVWLEVNGERRAEREGAIQAARRLLKEGKILAVKGLGGFHLACDATNPTVVEELRHRKQRSDKPFALMGFDLASVERHCIASAEEAEMLQTRQRPIVLLERKPGSAVAPGVAPNQHTLGVMLAYTPLHLLLLEPEEGFPDLWVMTSGNLSEEPIAYTDADARQKLAPMADAFLMHDRPIHMRVDDSVVRSTSAGSYFTRRSRGYAPDPIILNGDLPQVLAAGAELKNTFCLTRQRYAFVSHHIGDLENYETLRSFEEGITHLERLFKIHPELIACDLHPNYLATQYARERAQNENLPIFEIQHHHAHLAACLAENGVAMRQEAIGFSFDGTGYGEDGAIWGGEVLVGGCADFRRRFHLAYMPLPGGDSAIRKPARMALSALSLAGLDWEPDLPPVGMLCAEERTVLHSQLQLGLNAPPTSSMGRLFDAVSALLGVCETASYEGQAAIELEAIADPAETGFYTFAVEGDIINPAPVLNALLVDWRSGAKLPQLSARFHNSVVELVRALTARIRNEENIDLVALSGGVWQNRFLLEKTLAVLHQDGYHVLIHRQLPPNDACISLGQAVIAAARHGGK